MTERAPHDPDAIREAVRSQIADPDVYDQRVAYRGGNSVIRFRHPRTGRWVVSANPRERAGDAVHTGTIKALTTSALPPRPSVAWLVTVDKNAARDLARQEARAALQKTEIVLLARLFPEVSANEGEHDDLLRRIDEARRRAGVTPDDWWMVVQRHALGRHLAEIVRDERSLVRSAPTASRRIAAAVQAVKDELRTPSDLSR